MSILMLGLVFLLPTLWNMLPSSVKSVENTAKFRRHLKARTQGWTDDTVVREIPTK